MRLLQLISKHYNHLSYNDLYILEFVQENIEFRMSHKLADISHAANISPSTITRTAKKLGFKGFGEFRYFLVEEQRHRKLDKKSLTQKFMPSCILNDVETTALNFLKRKNKCKKF